MPTPTPEDSIPSGALVLAWKLIDADGDANTFSDQELAAGWTVDLETDGFIFGWNPVTSVDERYHAFFAVAIDEPTEAVITEADRRGYDLIDATCVDITEGPHAFPGNPRTLAAGDLVGALDGGRVRFTMRPDDVIACVFVNGPVREASVGGVTVTLPPTETIGGRAAPGDASWRMALVVLAGLVAGLLSLSPDHRTRRPR